MPTLPRWLRAKRLAPVTVRARVQTKPVVDYYAKQGLYSPVDANQKADTVKSVIAAILSK